MLIPPPEEGRYDRLAAGPAALSPGPGITLAGTPAGTGSKLEALPPDVLAAAVREYDLVLIEGDGSRGLPLKAWAAHEPVVPPFTTATAGIMPLWPLGLPASDRIIHRLPLFTALGGAAEGEPLRPEHLARVITGTGGAGRGLFTEARGARILFFNQIDDGDLRQAEGLAALLPPESPPALRWIIAGSVLRNRVSVIAP
jgi:probable selenium-dependent hydroxylase accessory protein YqeC